MKPFLIQQLERYALRLTELDFLLSAAEHGGWGAKRFLARANPARTLPLMTDASGDGVIAIVIPGIAACVFKLQQANRLTVPELELAGALLALIRYGPFYEVGPYVTQLTPQWQPSGCGATGGPRPPATTCWPP